MLFAYVASISAVAISLAAMLVALRWSSAAHLRRSLTSKLGCLQEAVEDLREWTQRIDARDKMRRVRAKNRDSAEPETPDPITQPAEWKAHMRAKLHRPQVAAKE